MLDSETEPPIKKMQPSMVLMELATIEPELMGMVRQEVPDVDAAHETDVEDNNDVPADSDVDVDAETGEIAEDKDKNMEKENKKEVNDKDEAKEGKEERHDDIDRDEEIEACSGLALRGIKAFENRAHGRLAEVCRNYMLSNYKK